MITMYCSSSFYMDFAPTTLCKYDGGYVQNPEKKNWECGNSTLDCRAFCCDKYIESTCKKYNGKCPDTYHNTNSNLKILGIHSDFTRKCCLPGKNHSEDIKYCKDTHISCGHGLWNAGLHSAKELQYGGTKHWTIYNTCCQDNSFLKDKDGTSIYVVYKNYHRTGTAKPGTDCLANEVSTWGWCYTTTGPSWEWGTCEKKKKYLATAQQLSPLSAEACKDFEKNFLKCPAHTDYHKCPTFKTAGTYADYLKYHKCRADSYNAETCCYRATIDW